MKYCENKLEFVPLYFADKLRVINPYGRIGIITLWSNVEVAQKKLRDLGIDLDAKTSEIAVIGNLYGNGLPHLLRNLLYNPQIRDLIVCGRDKSNSANELVSFFENGLEEVTSLGEMVFRIDGTDRIIDANVAPTDFVEKPRMTNLGGITDDDFDQKILQYFKDFKTDEPISTVRVEVLLPLAKIQYYPSEIFSHQIVEDTPLSAWVALIDRIVRFGQMVQLKKGDRQELPNVRVVIKNPHDDNSSELEKFGFRIEELRQYQADMLQPQLPEDQSYTYGNRIYQYFGYDALNRFSLRLKKDHEDRHCFLSLWDSQEDGSRDSAPCLVSLFFRVINEKLTLTANYRTHNALDAWLKNIYGLMKAQEIVSKETGIQIGALTVISNSISVDPSKYSQALRIAESHQQFSVKPDPCGQIRIEVDSDAVEIVIYHLDDSGRTLGEYRAKNAERLQHEIARDLVISDIGHALYVGRQLAIAEACLKSNTKFLQN